MIRSGQIAEPPRESVSLRLLTAARWICFGLFLASLGLVAAEMSGATSLPGNPGWPHALLLIAVAGSTLVSLSRELPGQNILLAAAIIGGLGTLLQALGGWAALPVNPNPTSPAGRLPQNLFPWWIPLVWISALLNSRGAARLILRPWRQTPTYGFRLLALAGALSLVFIAGLEAFATSAGGSWFLEQSRTGWTWREIPLAHFLVLLPATVIILALATPALINKKPVSFPPDFFPLITWTLLNLLFVIGTATRQLWPAAVLSSVAVAVAVVFALRGAGRRSQREEALIEKRAAPANQPSGMQPGE